MKNHLRDAFERNYRKRNSSAGLCNRLLCRFRLDIKAACLAADGLDSPFLISETLQ